MTWDDFETEVVLASRPNAGKCGVRVLLDGLTNGARDKVASALANEALSNAAIAHALRKRLADAAPRAYTIGRHRRGDCSCSKE